MEYYPFFQFTGYNVEIKYNKSIIMKIYHYDNKCYPYQDVKFIDFLNNKNSERDGYVRIGTFSILLLFNLINFQRYRVLSDDENKYLYYFLAVNLIQIRTKYTPYYFLMVYKHFHHLYFSYIIPIYIFTFFSFLT